uniref:Uncharacterized LOC109992812 n=1 Tax=Labrus bergylta TaxID=56723 RepID=A0A3Q3E062_9LABR|nr:uncharacterized protein LOC109992812 isoform X1 [Labrus bergylta]
MMPRHIFLFLLSEIYQVSAATSDVKQGSGVITATLGQNVTLPCSCENDAVTFFTWYQQHLGDKPVIISTLMKHKKEASISPAYKERFKVAGQGGVNNLVIRDVLLSDSAIYYCGILEYNTVEFGKGVFLHVKSSSSKTKTVVHQSALGPLRVGDSVNLSCTVHAESCAEQQSFYWFRHGAAQPAIIYHNAGECIKDPGSHMRNCTLNLPLKSVSSSDAGMYYCALASCGEVVFGNGTRVQIGGDSANVPSLLAYFLSVALAVFIIVLLVLTVIMQKLKNKSCSTCKGSAASEATGGELNSHDADHLHYAALSLNRTTKRHRQKDNVTADCVYSRVRRE